MSHTQLDDGNSATDSDANDSAAEADGHDAALQQAHSDVAQAAGLPNELVSKAKQSRSEKKTLKLCQNLV